MIEVLLAFLAGFGVAVGLMFAIYVYQVGRERVKCEA